MVSRGPPGRGADNADPRRQNVADSGTRGGGSAVSVRLVQCLVQAAGRQEPAEDIWPIERFGEVSRGVECRQALGTGVDLPSHEALAAGRGREVTLGSPGNPVIAGDEQGQQRLGVCRLPNA